MDLLESLYVKGFMTHLRISCLIAVLFISVPHDSFAFHAALSPKTVSPGDVFLIKVSGTRTSGVPHASLSGKEFYFSRCGRGSFVAIGAEDIDTKPGVHTVRLKVGKKKRKLKLWVRKSSFPEQEITLPADKVFLKPEDLERVKKEDERLEDIFETISGKCWEGDFAPPAR